jgi:uncharacterized repeat protein (TIGR03803 family)
MPTIVQHRISGVSRRVASAALALAVMLAPTLVATPSACAQSFSVIYTFTGGPDGDFPFADLVRDAAGNLYGTTPVGGDVSCNRGYGCGTVFKIDPAGNKTVLHRFKAGIDEGFPYAGLIRDATGNLYGTTSGFVKHSGTVFKLDPNSTMTVLYSFQGGTDGAYPVAGLVRDEAGNLYGTTPVGGVGCQVAGCGTVFKLDKSGSETVLYSFTGGADGEDPVAGLVVDAAGYLYGATRAGGAFGMGTVFKLDKTGTYSLLYTFGTRSGDGEYPYGSLAVDSAGTLYGTTFYGGVSSKGTVFKVDKSGNESVRLSFKGYPEDGDGPQAGLVGDAEGNLYGTTRYGGVYGEGTVFKLDKGGKETVLYSFTGGADGKNPLAGLVRDAAGNLYGTTSAGGTGCGGAGCGTVFKLTP